MGAGEDPREGQEEVSDPPASHELIRDLGLFFILAHTLAFSFSCRFYYDSRSQRSQWDHPLDGVYKDKVKAARQAAARKPRVLGDVTNSKARRGGESQRGKKAGGGERK